MKRALLAAAFSLISSSVTATDSVYAYYNGNDIITDCVDGSSNFQSCIGYVMGIGDSLELRELICRPGGITAGQLRNIALKHLENNPEDTHHPASYLLQNAFQEAYPCK